MLSHRSDYISIYSNSWGPSDSGFAVGGPGKYTTAVLQQGAAEVGHLLPHSGLVDCSPDALITLPLCARVAEGWAAFTHLQVVMEAQMVTHVQLMDT